MKKMFLTMLSTLFSLTFFCFWDDVQAAVDYSAFNSTYPVSAYYPYSSNKANNLGTYQLINNVKNDYSTPNQKQYTTAPDGQLDYFGLNQSSNKYYSWNNTSINNSGTILGPDPLVTPGLHPAVPLPVPPETIISATGESKTLYFHYYVVQVVKNDVRWSTEQTFGTNYAMQPLDILPTNTNFAWAYYSESPGAIIKYMTTDETELFRTPTIVGEIGESINSEDLTFDGYELFETPDAATFSEEKKVLTYVYRKLVDSSSTSISSTSSTDNSSVPPNSTNSTNSLISTNSTDNSSTSTFSTNSSEDANRTTINTTNSSNKHTNTYKEYPKTGSKDSSILFTIIGSLSMVGAVITLRKYNR